MKRKRKNNDIHTNTKGFSLSLRLMRKGLKLLSLISPALTVMVVTRMFCKPARKKIRKKQELFYESGTTDTLRIGGYTVKVLKKGNGRSVFMVHGWGSYGYDMKNVVDALVRKGYQVILPDLPCHGRSSGIFTEQIKVSRVIEELLLHYNAQRPIEQIVTHSWGGTSTLLALDRIYKSNYIGFNIKRMVSVSMPSRLDAVMNIFCMVLNLSEKIKKGLLVNINKIARSDDRSVEEAFPIGLTDLLQVPKFDYLLIHGKRDRAISYANTVRLANKFPQLRTQIDDNMGHMNILMRTSVHEAILSHLAVTTKEKVASMAS